MQSPTRSAESPLSAGRAALRDFDDSAALSCFVAAGRAARRAGDAAAAGRAFCLEARVALEFGEGRPYRERLRTLLGSSASAPGKRRRRAGS